MLEGTHVRRLISSSPLVALALSGCASGGEVDLPGRYHSSSGCPGIELTLEPDGRYQLENQGTRGGGWRQDGDTVVFRAFALSANGVRVEADVFVAPVHESIFGDVTIVVDDDRSCFFTKKAGDRNR